MKLDWNGNMNLASAKEVWGGFGFRSKEPKWFVKAKKKRIY
jgi:hypothetical protein